jgi:Pycsar effector protein
MNTDEEAKQEFLWRTHQYLNEYLRFGDTKAAFTGTISTALLGALYSAKIHVSLMQTDVHQWDVSAWLAVVGAFFLTVSVGLAVSTVRPRLKTTQTKGYIFWQTIRAHKTAGLFKIDFDAQTMEALNDCIAHHNFDLSVVGVEKYRSISLGISMMVIGAILTAGALVMHDKATSETLVLAPPCKTGAPTCEPWERDWSKSKTELKPGSQITRNGVITSPK